MHPIRIKIDPAPLCSVCIANYNGEKFLAECIDSVLNQKNFPGEVEIIVHDDASTDSSVDLIQTKYPQVRLITSDKNVGFCTSNNRMVENATGKFILLLNNDAVLHVDALQTVYDYSKNHGDGIYGLPQYDAATGALIDIGSIFDPFLNPIPNTDFDRRNVGMVIGACLWISRHLWHQLGGFPEWFGSLAEDMYICCLARLRGLPVKIAPTSGFDHWVGQSLGGGKVTETKKLTTKLYRRAFSERNKTFVMLICYPPLMACTLIPLHLICLTIEGLILSVIKKDKRIWLQIYCFCLKEIWKKRAHWISHRQSVQPYRICKTVSFFSVFTMTYHKLRMVVKYGLPDVQ